MKKVLLFTVSLIVSGSVMAQNLINETPLKLKDLGDFKDVPQQSIRRDASTGWYLPYSYTRAASQNANGFQSYVSLLFPDSTVFDVQNTSNTDPTPILRGHNDMSWGHIFDPVNGYIQLDQNGLDVYTQHQQYTWDSVFFRMGYVRQVDSVDNGSGNEAIVDTLFVRYYSNSTGGVGTGTLAGLNTYARVLNYNGTLGYATTQFKTDTIPLTSADTTGRSANGWTTLGVALPVEHSVPISSSLLARRLVGFTIHFKPGRTYAAGDTLVDLTTTRNVNIAKKNNYIVTSMLIDENAQSEQVPSGQTWDNSLYMPKASRYAVSNTWFGYVPGNAYFSNRYLICGFHISTNNLSVGSLDDIGAKVGEVYPNPASKGQISIPVTVRSSSNVIVTITDVNGKSVYNNGHEVVGADNVNLSIDNLATGIYNVSVNIEGIVTTKKLMVK